MSMFKDAKPVAVPKAPKAKDKSAVALKDLEKLAKLNAAIEALAGLQSQLAAQIKEAALGVFIDEGHKIERRPPNFRGIDGTASASVELRKRASTSPLSAEQVTLLKEHDMTPKKEIIVNKMFGINPVYAEDEKLLDAVSTALEGIVPSDFIVTQEEKSKFVVTDEMVDAAFKKDIPREVVETVSVMALKPKLEVTDIISVMADVLKMLEPEEQLIA